MPAPKKAAFATATASQGRRRTDFGFRIVDCGLVKDRKSFASGLRFWPAFYAVHASEVAAIMSWRNFQCPLKNIAHRIDIPKAAFAGNRFHAVLTLFQPTACCF